VYINPRILFPVQALEEYSEELLEDIDFHANMRLSDYELAEDLERVRKFKPAGRLLEIGSGTGAFLSLASNSGYQAMGIEPRKRYAEYARHRFGVDVIEGLVGDPRQSAELPGDEFDVVVMLAVIEHVLDIQKVIQNVHKFLRRGGVFYLMTPDVNSLYARIHGLRWNHYHVCWHHQFFSKHALRRLLSDRGFRILKTWGGYRGRQSYWRRIIKSILSTLGVSLDVIAVLSEKIK
jgi:SAM-dependent methyltransferase